MRLVRPRNVNRPLRTRLGTAHGHVEVQVADDGTEYVDTEDNGIASALVKLHGFGVLADAVEHAIASPIGQDVEKIAEGILSGSVAEVVAALPGLAKDVIAALKHHESTRSRPRKGVLSALEGLII